MAKEHAGEPPAQLRRQIQSVIDRLDIRPVMTAHPTEAARRTLLEKHRRIADLLTAFDLTDLRREDAKCWMQGWPPKWSPYGKQTKCVQTQPTVLDEVNNGLYYFDATLFEAVPRMLEEIEQRLGKDFPGVSLKDGATPVRFGSWIGGDRDGNPFVTPEVTWETLLLQQRLVLRKYLAAVADLGRV
jgi:phosphoenolpyruvate carboxylase